MLYFLTTSHKYIKHDKVWVIALINRVGIYPSRVPPFHSSAASHCDFGICTFAQYEMLKVMLYVGYATQTRGGGTFRSVQHASLAAVRR